MLTTREAIALKIETTYKTEAVPNAATESILVSDLSHANEGLTMVDRNNIKPTISTDQKIFAGTLKKLTFTAEIKGSGTAGTPPEIAQALRCCGLDETVVASTSVTYQPVSEGHESCTIYYYQDGKLLKLLGARGTVNLMLEAKNIGKAEFEFIGHDGGEVDASFPALSYDSTVPVPFMDVSFSVDSFPAIINSMNINAGNEMVMPGNVSDTYGFGEVRISMRDPNGAIDPEATLVATKDFKSIFEAGTQMALTTGVVGSQAGNRFQVDANIALRDIAQGDRDQIRTNELTFGCHEQTADDEWLIAFT